LGKTRCDATSWILRVGAENAAEVKDVDRLNRLFQALQRLPDVLDISRAVGGREK
jgi:hypothetical protein